MDKLELIMKRRLIKRHRAAQKTAKPVFSPDVFPARTRRNRTITEALGLVGRTAVIAGRVVELKDDCFVLADETGKITVVSPELPTLFSIIEIEGATVLKGEERIFDAVAGRELVPAGREPTSERQWERFILNPETRTIVAKRARLLEETHRFFRKRGFLEVDTPSLVAVPGMEPYLEPLETVVKTAAGAARGFLATSPEYCLKKLLVGGFEKIFEISRSFRNGEALGGLHNPEFLMLEWYRAYASYIEIMDDVEEFVKRLAKEALKTEELKARGSRVKLGGKWERLRISEAFQRYAGIDLEKNLATETLRRTLRAKGYRPGDEERYEDLFFRVFLNEIEPCLGRKAPTIVYDYPLSLAALAKRSAANPRFAERFEVYVAGAEIANGFTELNDPEEQLARLSEEYKLRRKLKKTLFGPDPDFVDALKTGMPPAGGVALGLDRLFMLLLGLDRIEEVRLFPAAELFAFTKNRKQD